MHRSRQACLSSLPAWMSRGRWPCVRIWPPVAPWSSPQSSRGIFLTVIAARLLLTPGLSGTCHGVEGPRLPVTVSPAPWQRLFDGQTTSGWRAWLGQSFPSRGWAITNQCLVRRPGPRAGDLVTESEFEDFGLEWEWRIVRGGNNGVKYLVLESRPSAPGPEYQMVDDRTVRDPRHRTAAFYDVLAPHPAVTAHPPGQWNRSRIVVCGATVQHWLNDICVLTCELGSPNLREALRHSKFRNQPGFGEKCRGRIMLTDHGTETWFRNIRIHPLPTPSVRGPDR